MVNFGEVGAGGRPDRVAERRAVGVGRVDVGHRRGVLRHRDGGGRPAVGRDDHRRVVHRVDRDVHRRRRGGAVVVGDGVGEAVARRLRPVVTVGEGAVAVPGDQAVRALAESGDARRRQRAVDVGVVGEHVHGHDRSGLVHGREVGAGDRRVVHRRHVHRQRIGGGAEVDAVAHLEADDGVGAAVLVGVRHEPQPSGRDVERADLLVERHVGPVAGAREVVLQAAVARERGDLHRLQRVAVGVGIGAEVAEPEHLRGILESLDRVVGRGRRLVERRDAEQHVVLIGAPEACCGQILPGGPAGRVGGVARDDQRVGAGALEHIRLAVDDVALRVDAKRPGGGHGILWFLDTKPAGRSAPAATCPWLLRASCWTTLMPGRMTDGRRHGVHRSVEAGRPAENVDQGILALSDSCKLCEACTVFAARWAEVKPATGRPSPDGAVAAPVRRGLAILGARG